MKKITALFAALCLFVSIVPASTFATEADAPPTGDAPTTTLLEISDFTEPDVIEIANGDTRTEEEIISTFPDFVLATVDGVEDTQVPVSAWTRVHPAKDIAYSTSAAAEFFYEPTIDSSIYSIANTAIMPNQMVRVGNVVHVPTQTSLTGSEFAVAGDPGHYSWDDTAKVLTITGDGALEISMATAGTTTKHTIVVQDGITANLTLNSVRIIVGNTGVGCAFEVKGTATANITLIGNNWISSGMNEAGIKVQSGATLLITDASTGRLDVYGGENDYPALLGCGAGIGSNPNETSGTITISGGTIYAQGGESGGAGIGGGSNGAGGIINITNGTVTAQGREGGAGIGGGADGAGGVINITGGIVEAEGNPGGRHGGAGIGCGQNGTGGTIDISGGNVTATGGGYDAGIDVGGSGTITVSGGAVSAMGGNGNPGSSIAPSVGINSGTINIMGGTVTATGGSGAQALSTKPTYTLPAPSAGQFYSVSITAGATQTGATAKTPSEDYVTGLGYARIAMSSATPQISITPTKTLTYNGKEQTQNVSVKLGSVSLAEGTHYTISGNTATNAGNHTLTVTILPLGAGGVYDTTAGTNYLGNGTTATASYSIAALPTTSSTTTTTTYNPAISPQTGVYN